MLLFYARGMKKEMSLLYLLRFIYKGIRELLRTFQGHQMLSQKCLYSESVYR